MKITSIYLSENFQTKILKGVDFDVDQNSPHSSGFISNEYSFHMVEFTRASLTVLNFQATEREGDGE